jgi:hypothetical protein
MIITGYSPNRKIKASLRKGTDKIDAEGGRIIKMYYYANKELYIIIIIIINNGGKVICLPNFGRNRRYFVI